MKNTYTLLWLLAATLFSLPITAQTTLSGGELTGTLTKAGSPYTVTADLTVPKGKSIVMEPGVEMYFNQHIGMDVYGQITAEGTASDSIIFTASDTALGWYGIRIRKTLSEEEEQAFSYCQFSYHFLIKHAIADNHGVLLLDSVLDASVKNCLFTQNRSARVSGLIGIESTVELEDCVFKRNYAIDTNTLLSNSIEVHAVGSGASFGTCDLRMSSCLFEYNESYTPYFDIEDIRTKGGGIVFSATGKAYIDECVFRYNKVQDRGIIGLGGRSGRTDSLVLTNCTLYQNQILDGAILSMNSGSDDQFNVMITDCIFEENYGPDTANSTSTISSYNSFGSTNERVFERCTLLNNDNYSGINIDNSSRIYFNNGAIMGQNGGAISINKSVNSRILNSVIANNFAGISSNFNSKLGVINSIVAYNGNEAVSFAGSGYGLFYSDLGRMDIINSIVTNNVGSTGRMANVTSTSRSYSPGFLHNSIVEGGTDSSYKFGQDWAIEEGATNFLTVKNVINKPVTFVKPPLGVGRAYASLDNDFHILQDCDSTPTYDQGDYFNPPYPLNSWNDIDRDGNARILGKSMDIGPYELSGEKFETVLFSPWPDTMLCDNNLAAFNPAVLGQDLDYTWQTSTDNATWSDMPSGSFSDNELTDPSEGYYRVITKQAECNVLDTFGGTKLGILEAPQPDLGADRSIGNDSMIWLTPGQYSDYKWSFYTKPRDSSHALLNGRQYPDDSKKIIWVDVTAANGCIARDSIIIYFGTAGVFRPSIGSISVYPNPASSYLKLELDVSNTTSVVIVNMMGQTVLVQEELDTLTTLDISNLSQGSYIVILSQGEAIYSTRIVKE
jgi:hypothetical protein